MTLTERVRGQESASGLSQPGWLQVHAAWIAVMGCTLFWAVVIALAWLSL